jgi:misacylated tRNA(Ala) deacylase
VAGAQIEDRDSVREDLTHAMPTECLFREDAYLRDTAATVVALSGQNVVLDRTVFYATSGGQPGDRGALLTSGGLEIPIASAIFTDAAKSEIAHMPAPSPSPAGGGGGPQPIVGETVTARIDWDLRYARMRMHTALHLLSAVLPYPVTGGSVGEAESRLDFDIPEAGLDKDAIAAKLNEMIAADAEVRHRWITDEELADNPGLVKTMSVKPPMGTGRVRLVEIVGFDLQPCGGTHVRRTSEIGAVRVTQIEKKGKQNRRVRIALA